MASRDALKLMLHLTILVAYLYGRASGDNSRTSRSAPAQQQLTPTINGHADQTLANATNGSSDTSTDDGAKHSEVKPYHGERFEVLKFDFQKVAAPFFISFWILIASVAKIGFHFSHKLSSVFPESSLLIVLGIIMGVVFYYSTHNENHMMNAHTFFYFLLPPIILESGYFMPNRAFFDNIGTILLYAVVGTLFNTFTIGFSLWGLSVAGVLGGGNSIQLLHCLLFSSLVSAVDPVAVLAVFEEINVNEMLHIIVFGESLLNDAVTVVLYHMFEAYSHMGAENIQVIDVAAGAAAFVLVGIGGTAIGLLFGLIAAFVTKFTSHVRVIEPMLVFLIAYLSYLTAEVFHFSGIMALTFCGITMRQYVEFNISEKSQTTVKYFMKMLSSVSETIIFLFLGTSTVTDSHSWDAVFIVSTLSFCLLYRAIGVVTLTALINRHRLLKLTYVDQFVMSYGGLRGAVAFALAITLDSSVITSKNIFVTATIVVIMFTVFVQGITVKPLVNMLHVKKKDKRELSMNEQINERLLDHLMAGVEDITGFHGNHWLRDKFEYYDNKYLKKYLLRERPKTRETAILRVSSRLSLRDAIEQIQKPGALSRASSSASLGNVSPANEPSLTKLIRNWSNASFQEGNGIVEMDTLTSKTANGTVIDMQALEATYSKKMADDSKIHHILTDNMIHAKKKWTKRKRHELDERDDHAPTHRHHHTFRIHLRPVISQQQQRKQQRSRRTGAPVAAAPSADESKCPKNVTFCRLPDIGDQCEGAVAKIATSKFDIIHSDSVDGMDDEDDGGIIFRVSTSATEPLPEDLLSTTADAVVSRLPWRAETDGCIHFASSSGLSQSDAQVNDVPCTQDSCTEVATAIPARQEVFLATATILPWRQVDDSQPELSYRAQSEVPLLALVGDTSSDGGSTATSPMSDGPTFLADSYEHSPIRRVAISSVADYPAGGGMPSWLGLQQPIIFLPAMAARTSDELSKPSTVSLSRNGVAGRITNALDGRYATRAQEALYEADEETCSNDEGGSNEDTEEDRGEDTVDEETPLTYKLRKAKNSIEKLHEHLLKDGLSFNNANNH